MSAPTVKPGTRCECRDGAQHRHDPPTNNCHRDAVRMAKIEHTDGRPQKVKGWFWMCEPCAAYAESKVTK